MGGDGPLFQTWRSPREGGAAGARLRALRVVAVAGARGSLVPLRGELAIGREPPGAGGLALADREVSRLHARVLPEGDGDTLVDAGSRNGCWLNGLRVMRAPLRHGDVLRLGRTLLLYLDEPLRADEPDAAPLPGVIAESVAMRRVAAEARLVAPHAAPVLVTGDTGVGKEVVARAIHALSGRDGPFVALNCAAIAAGVAESELFGHAQGAFTGAARSHPGLFAAAAGGTLFLDEIGEMAAELQPKLLRALATGEVRAVGATAAQELDVRVVAATNRDLAAAVAAGRFRADLYARLHGYAIHVPRLGERRDDIVPIATAFLASRAAPPLSPDAAEALLLHDWPLNVRELERAVEAAAVRAAGGKEIAAGHLPPGLAARLGERAAPRVDGSTPAPPLSLLVSRDGVPTREELCEVLARFAGNVARVADFFGKERQQIYRWARRHGVDPRDYRR
jgi:transcriptional regulator with GAF, ATPase, and Fis domain